MQTTTDITASTNAPGPGRLTFSFATEFAGARFGDRRLTKRAVRFLDGALVRPESSLPKMAGGESGAEGVYRLIANDKVTASKLADPHEAQTLGRCQAVGAVLVLHDTTTFGYGKDTKRQGMGIIAGGGMGFLAHVSLCVSEASRQPLGVLKHQAWARTPAPTQPAKGKPGHKRRAQTAENNESHRWLKQAKETGKMLGAVPHVHVADRESDDYKYLAALDDAGEAFVTRVSGNRSLGNGVDLFAKMDGMVVELCREVRLSRRGAEPGPAQRKAHPPRAERMARLEISAGRQEIRRATHAPRTAPKSLQLNYVLVREIDMPEGAEPVIWRLVTNLPVDTPEQIARVVDIYRSRWVIEEFFKALKTGCAFNNHQLESFEALSKLLALLLPLAWRLLELRSVARADPDAPAKVVLTAQQVAFLRVLHDRQHPKSPMAAKPTVKDVVYAVARLGGHFKQNGDPGWQTLGAGLQMLLQAEDHAMALIAAMPHLQGKR